MEAGRVFKDLLARFPNLKWGEELSVEKFPGTKNCYGKNLQRKKVLGQNVTQKNLPAKKVAGKLVSGKMSREKNCYGKKFGKI